MKMFVLRISIKQTIHIVKNLLIRRMLKIYLKSIFENIKAKYNKTYERLYVNSKGSNIVFRMSCLVM